MVQIIQKVPLPLGYHPYSKIEFSLVSIKRMGAADFMLFALLTLANASLLAHVHRRRVRREREARMMRSLRNAIRREVTVVPVREATQELALA
jgi:hypothetical protein